MEEIESNLSKIHEKNWIKNLQEGVYIRQNIKKIEEKYQVNPTPIKDENGETYYLIEETSQPYRLGQYRLNK